MPKMPEHDYRDSEFYLDVCGFEHPDTRQMCGAPKVHPWHGYDRVQKTVMPSHRRRMVHDRRRGATR